MTPPESKSAKQIAALCQQAVALHQNGRPEDAEQIYLQVLEIEPANFVASHSLGVIRSHQGRHGEALALIGAALRSKPSDAGALWAFANELIAVGRPADALAYYDKAIAVQPSFPEAYLNRGVLLGSMGRADDALASYDRALALKPGFTQVLLKRGQLLASIGRPEEALISFQEVLAIEPGRVEALFGRGVVLQSLGRLPEALAAYDNVLARHPRHAGAWNNRGVALLELGKNAEALGSFDKVLAADPQHVEAWNNRGSCLEYLRRFDEALDSYERALVVRPDNVAALYNRANLLWDRRRDVESALRDLEKIVALDPSYPYARGDLLHLRMYNGDWRDFEGEANLLQDAVRKGQRAAKPFVYQAISQSPADLQICSKTYADHNFPPREPLYRQSRSGVRAKIRVGYVSGEFRDQATAHLMAGLYERHDKAKFEIIAFDNGWDDHSTVRARLEAAFDKFVGISNMSDQEAAEAIVAEKIDILVNLNGYFGLPRMGVFAHRPAPVQVNYLGFPATLGASYMDYIVADKYVIPESAAQFYTEKVATLPHSYQVNDDRRPIAGEKPGRSEHGLPEGAFVFCNFNQSYKLTPMMFEAWMHILRQVDGSVLWLLGGTADFSGNLRKVAATHGVEANRLVFAPFASPDDHLARLRLADLFLDSLPYNAHTSGSDALWAGVPLLTCLGETFPGRVAASLLHAVGLPELVTGDLREYVSLAVKLAAEPDLLRSFRERLAHNRTHTPLFDTDRFRRNIEAAYITMWDIHNSAGAPRNFTVPEFR